MNHYCNVNDIRIITHMTAKQAYEIACKYHSTYDLAGNIPKDINEAVHLDEKNYHTNEITWLICSYVYNDSIDEIEEIDILVLDDKEKVCYVIDNNGGYIMNHHCSLDKIRISTCMSAQEAYKVAKVYHKRCFIQGKIPNNINCAIYLDEENSFTHQPTWMIYSYLQKKEEGDASLIIMVLDREKKVYGVLDKNGCLEKEHFCRLSDIRIETNMTADEAYEVAVACHAKYSMQGTISKNREQAVRLDEENDDTHEVTWLVEAVLEENTIDDLYSIHVLVSDNSKEVCGILNCGLEFVELSKYLKLLKRI